jgi:hypothetical protein
MLDFAVVKLYRDAIPYPQCVSTPATLTGRPVREETAMTDASEDGSAYAGELAKLEAQCQSASREIATARNVAEAYKLADISVPSHLKPFVRHSVPTLGRLPRALDKRVDEIVRDQLDGLRRERAEMVASREFDRIKALDWHVLRSHYPDLYNKSMREANLILERKRNAK